MHIIISLFLCFSVLTGAHTFAASFQPGDLFVVMNGSGQVFQATPVGSGITTSSVPGASVFNLFPVNGSVLLSSGQSSIGASSIPGATALFPPTGASVFNPFPLNGAAAPLVSAPGNIIIFPSGAPTALFPQTGASILNPFPLNGAAAPLASAQSRAVTPVPAAGATVFLVSSGGTLTPLPITAIPVGTGLSTLAQPGSTVLIQNPEPSSLILFITGLAAFLWLMRKQVAKRTL